LRKGKEKRGEKKQRKPETRTLGAKKKRIQTVSAGTVLVTKEEGLGKRRSETEKKKV